jgi:hypothetical protein
MNSKHPTHRVRNVLAAVALTLSVAGAAHAQAYANVTVGGAFAPGVYGQISLGNNAPPPVWNAQPVMHGQPVYGAPVMYLHVPQEEYRDWGRHCARYRACGHPVYFVRAEQSNRWWERHSEHLRGPDYYRQLEARPYGHREERRVEHRRDSRNDQYDNQRYPRQDNRNGER